MSDSEENLDAELLHGVTINNLALVKERLAQSTNKLDRAIALEWAADKGRLDIVKELISQGADPNSRSALAWAARNGHLEVVKHLVSVGADPKADDSQALRWAEEEGRTEVVKFLELWEKDDALFKVIREGLVVKP